MYMRKPTKKGHEIDNSSIFYPAEEVPMNHQKVSLEDTLGTFQLHFFLSYVIILSKKVVINNRQTFFLLKK